MTQVCLRPALLPLLVLMTLTGCPPLPDDNDNSNANHNQNDNAADNDNGNGNANDNDDPDPGERGATEVVRIELANLLGVSLSPDGRRLAAGDQSGIVRVWSVPGGAQTLQFDDDRDPNHDAGAGFVAITPDNRHIIACGGRPSPRSDTLYRWSLDTGLPDRRISLGTPIRRSAVSADGTQVLIGFGRSAGLWDVDSQTQLWSVELCDLFGQPDCDEFPADVALSADGSLALVAAANFAALLDATNGALIRRFADGFSVDTGHFGPILAAALSPDGALVATASSDGTTKVWQTVNGTLLNTLAHAAFSPSATITFLSNERLLSPRGRGIIWNAVTGEVELEFFAAGLDSGARRIEASADGRRVVTTYGNRIAVVWELPE